MRDAGAAMKPSWPRRFTSRLLLHLRLHRLTDEQNLDPASDAYLYLVLQQKRLSLSATYGKLRPRTILLWPFLLALVAIKTLDLAVSNQIVAAMLNERRLMQGDDRTDGGA
jgi:hypothetical protein